MEQIGSPFEIYNFPTTRFVANFVGSLNTAEAEIVDANGGGLNMNGVRLVTGNDLKGKGKGDKVTIAIRPERLNFLSEEKKDNVFDARVENITFLGSVVRIEVTIGDRKFSMDTFNRPSLQLPNIGDACQVTCSAMAVLILKE
jgi:putative spermidine/putrescine transport system ATP-binding protein